MYLVIDCKALVTVESIPEWSDAGWEGWTHHNLPMLILLKEKIE